MKKISLIFVSSAALLIAPAALAIKLPGEAFGPSKVRPGTSYHWHGDSLAPEETVHVSVQPLYCYGNPYCIARVKGTWKSTSRGAVRLAFIFPRSYGIRCARNGCERHQAFQAGEEAVVRLCVPGPTTGAHYGYRCLIKTVPVGQPAA